MRYYQSQRPGASVQPVGAETGPAGLGALYFLLAIGRHISSFWVSSCMKVKIWCTCCKKRGELLWAGGLQIFKLYSASSEFTSHAQLAGFH